MAKDCSTYYKDAPQDKIYLGKIIKENGGKDRISLDDSTRLEYETKKEKKNMRQRYITICNPMKRRRTECLKKKMIKSFIKLKDKSINFVRGLTCLKVTKKFAVTPITEISYPAFEPFGHISNI